MAIINEAAARKFFPSENPIGRRFGHSPEGTGNIEIVGVLRDVRYNSLREQPPPTLYMPHLQSNPEDLVFSVRTAGDPANVMSALRAAVSAADPNIPIVTVETQISTIERRFAQEKVLAQAYTLFGGIALFVAAIGLFGLMSYNVSRRTREIGIRMAMGAQRKEVLSLVLRESMVLVIAGIAIGIAGALGAGRFVASQLFGLEPTDPTTMMAAIVVMLAVSAAAGYLPARRAARVDPMVALQVRIEELEDWKIGRLRDYDERSNIRGMRNKLCSFVASALLAALPEFDRGAATRGQRSDLQQGRRADPLQALRQLSSAGRNRRRCRC